MNFGEKFEKEIEKQGFTEEQLNWLYDRFAQKVMYINGYKVKLGKTYLCYKTEFGGNTFYKILVQKKADGKKTVKAYKNVRFINCPSPKMENCEIVIKSMFEDFYFRKGDKYNAQFTLVITDYEFAEKSGAVTYEQISEYKDSVDYLSDDNFEIVGEPINTIDEEDFPF